MQKKSLTFFFLYSMILLVSHFKQLKFCSMKLNAFVLPFAAENIFHNTGRHFYDYRTETAYMPVSTFGYYLYSYNEVKTIADATSETPQYKNNLWLGISERPEDFLGPITITDFKQTSGQSAGIEFKLVEDEATVTTESANEDTPIENMVINMSDVLNSVNKKDISISETLNKLLEEKLCTKAQ